MIKQIRTQRGEDSSLINLLAIAGERNTSFSDERVRGLKDAVKKYGNVKILETVSTNWLYQESYSAVKGMYKKHKNSSIAGVWCANSDLARGASDALKAKGLKPNKDFVTVGIDWGKESIESVIRNDVLTIAGGHIASIAWLIVKIFDYHNGIDFDSQLCLNEISLINNDNSQLYWKFFEQSKWEEIDFKRYSKFYTEKPIKFSFDNIIKEFSSN